MNNILIFSFIILNFINAWLIAYLNLIQTTTLWLSKTFLQPLINHSPKQLQAIITPKSQNLRQMLFPILLIFLIVNCLLIHWYYLIIALLTVYILSILISILFYHKDLSYYILIIHKDLNKKKLRLEQKGEYANTLFLEEVLMLLLKAYLYAKEKNVEINKLKNL